MSKQPRSMREYIESLQSQGIMIPVQPGDPRQMWILVRQDPSDSSPGCFLVSHAHNLAKYKAKPGFEVLGWSYDRVALTLAARRATEVCGKNYAPRIRSQAKSDASLPDPNEGDLYDNVESPLLDLDEDLVLDDPKSSTNH